MAEGGEGINHDEIFKEMAKKNKDVARKGESDAAPEKREKRLAEEAEFNKTSRKDREPDHPIAKPVRESRFKNPFKK